MPRASNFKLRTRSQYRNNQLPHPYTLRWYYHPKTGKGFISEIVTVFNHTRQLLLNDELLENYFLIFSKQDNKVIIEIPMNNEVKDIGSKQPEQTSETNSFSKL